jgi:GxxExxY protein
MTDVLHQEITEQVIGAAFEVSNQLKPGLDEKLYENALLIELTDRGLGSNNGLIRFTTKAILLGN